VVLSAIHPKNIGNALAATVLTSWDGSNRREKYFGKRLEYSTIPSSNELEARRGERASGINRRKSCKASMMSDGKVDTDISAPGDLKMPSKERRVGATELEKMMESLGGTKPSLREARVRAPALFSTESDPIRFLQVANHDAIEALNRLETYWIRRKEIFGDRAYLPMVQTGQGALTPLEIQVLRGEQQWSLLPAEDKTGSPVYFVDCSDSFRGGVRATILRCLFYLLSAAVPNDKSQTDGVVLVVSLPEDGNPDNVSQSVESFLGLLLHAMPMRLKGLHFAAISKDSDTEDLLRTYLHENLGALVKEKCNVHVSATEGWLLRKLEAAGLPASTLPITVGGTWTNRDKLSWYEHIAKVEAEYDPPDEGALEATRLGVLAGFHPPTADPKSCPGTAGPTFPKARSVTDSGDSAGSGSKRARASPSGAAEEDEVEAKSLPSTA